MIDPDPTDITIMLEVLDLAHSEGKTTFDSFERYLSGRLMSPILDSSFTIDTELLIAAFLSKVDHLSENYQKKIARKLAEDFYTHLTKLYTRFNMSSDPNKQLIEMCVGKGIFDDSTRKSVVRTLSIFGEDLKRFFASPSSFE